LKYEISEKVETIFEQISKSVFGTLKLHKNENTNYIFEKEKYNAGVLLT